jgi:Domain of unknown function (DUF1854)
MNTLDASIVSIEQTAGGAPRVRLADGQDFRDVAFVQLFPNTDPRRYICVRQKQGTEYAEIGIIRDLMALPENARNLVLEDIRLRYFVPGITEIASITTRRGADTWIVETDRGRASFTVRERSENVTATDQGIVLITDTDKCRYKIADIRALPLKSRGFLEKVLM